jgi:hypothetical protein
VQQIANTRLVGNLTHQLNVSLAVAGQSHVQLSLQRGELRRTGQTLVQRTKLSEECDELLCDKRAIDSAMKPANANSNLNRQPVVVVILSDGLSLVAQHVYLDALML